MSSNTNSGVILIVEDPSIGRLVKRMLARDGRDAIETDAAQALEFIARGDSRVKLVITNQPRAFANLDGMAPLLCLASAPDLDLGEHVSRLRILRKPFKTKDLLLAVAELTAQAEAAGG
jgi:CheY-like chemotaxis protein